MTTATPVGNAYDKYASSNPIERKLMARFLDTLDSLLPAVAPAKVLEIGVGEGEVMTRIAARYPDAVRIGLDILDEDLPAQWRHRPFAPLFGDARGLPFPDGAFDLVLAIEVLEHVAPPGPALDELARVTSKHLIASVPREPIWRMANMARGKYLRDLGNTPGHLNHWGRRSFSATVGTTFDVTEVRSPFPWTMVAARRKA